MKLSKFLNLQPCLDWFREHSKMILNKVTLHKVQQLKDGWIKGSVADLENSLKELTPRQQQAFKLHADEILSHYATYGLAHGVEEVEEKIMALVGCPFLDSTPSPEFINSLQYVAYCSASTNNLKLVKFLFESSPFKQHMTISHDDYLAFIAAMQAGSSFDVAGYFLDHYNIPQEKIEQSLLQACQYEHKETIHYLIVERRMEVSETVKKTLEELNKDSLAKLISKLSLQARLPSHEKSVKRTKL